MTARRLVKALGPACTLGIGFLAITCGGDAVTPEATQDQVPVTYVGERLDSFLAAAVEAYDIPGLTVAVVRQGENVYENAFGVENLDTGEPLSPQHLFHFASVSKPFVATAVMQLVEQGKIDLDEKVITYLPYFELADPAYAEITIRQMLNHTSGMPDVEDYEWDNPQTDEGAAERYVRSLSGESMIGPPGGQCVYSNMAFDTLGDVIAKVSGLSFEAYVKKNILDPLGMVESDFLYPETNPELRTTGHVWNVGPSVSEHYPYNRRHAPSSTLNSSVHEMARWVQGNLQRGELEGTRILQDSSYDVLWAPSAEMGTSQVGLSWFLRDFDGIPTISHGGGDTGFSSYIILLPEDNSGFVLASNYDRTPMGMLRDGVIGILQGEEPDRPLRPIGSDFAKVYFEEGLESAKSFYQQAAENRATEYFFSDRQINSIGYLLLDQGDIEGAIEVLEFNATLYPEVGNAYDSLGEAYLAKGDDALAIQSYSKALELDPDNDHARDVLQSLGALPADQ
jgi:CubicO group peptidase (beta-lactamase class C family)